MSGLINTIACGFCALEFFILAVQLYSKWKLMPWRKALFGYPHGSVFWILLVVSFVFLSNALWQIFS